MDVVFVEFKKKWFTSNVYDIDANQNKGPLVKRHQQLLIL